MTGFPKILFDSRLADVTLVASSVAAGFDVQNLIDFRPYTWFKPNVMPATITANLTASGNADYCFVYGHDMGTQNTTFEVRGSTDNFGAVDDLVATISPADDKPFLLTFAELGYNDWRINLTGATAPSIAIISLGFALTFPRRLLNGFDPLGRKIYGQTNTSAKGYPLGKVFEFEEWNETLNFTNLTWDWIRTTFVPAWKAHLRGSPFGFAWDSVDHITELYLVESKDKFSTPHTQGSYAALTMDVSGVVP